jgi:hypothetical protein
MKRWLWLAAGVLAVSACGDSTDVDVDAEVAPFVGTWDAVVFRVTGDAPPHTVANVLTKYGPFWIDIQPSGAYTATIEFPGVPPELGTISVESSSLLTLHPTTGPPAPSTYVFAKPDSLILDGPTEFDLNDDFAPEPAQAHIELVRR